MKYFDMVTSIVCILLTIVAMMKISACSSEQPIAVLADIKTKLPTFSILLPLYHEAGMVEQLVKNVSKCRYPRDKLDIIIICEPEDTETIEAAKNLAVPPVRLFLTHGLYPRTKPNALNQAMDVATGDIITVYDAEDRPHPDQLLAAAHTLQANENLAVVQAPLTFYNFDDNWLTRQFTLEYDGLFCVWLPFLARLGVPFPLGGTSNHIRADALKQVGGWGMGYIPTPTFEECPKRWGNWRDQRQRWLKGFMQTVLTHLHEPWQPGGRFGIIRQIMLHLTVTATLIASLFHVPILVFIIGLSTVRWMMNHSVMPPLIFPICLLLSYIAGILSAAIGSRRAGHKGLIIWSLLQPFYWLCLVVPAIKALVALHKNPFHWNKTPHGHSQK